MNKFQYRTTIIYSLLLIVLTGFTPVKFAFGDYISPELVNVKTEKYTPERTDFQAGTYEYSVDWQGIPVGKASVSVSSAIPEGTNGKYTTVLAKASSGGVVKLFYTLRHVSESTFSSSTLKPISFYSVQSENKKTKSREVSFLDDGHIKSALWKQGKAEPEERYSFKSENTTFDPISAAFLARSLPVNLGTEYTFDVFNGKHRFLITLSVAGKEMIKLGSQMREAYKVIPTVKKLTDTEGEKRLRAATLWISTDEQRDVLKLKSQVLVGSVNAELVRFTPNSDPLPSNTARAALASPPELPKNFE